MGYTMEKSTELTAFLRKAYLRYLTDGMLGNKMSLYRVQKRVLRDYADNYDVRNTYIDLDTLTGYIITNTSC